MQLFPVLFLIFLNVTCLVNVLNPLHEQQIEKYGDFEFTVPSNTFSNTEYSNVFLALEDSEWLSELYVNPGISSMYEYLTTWKIKIAGDTLVCSDVYGISWIFDIEDPSEPVYRGRYDVALSSAGFGLSLLLSETGNTFYVSYITATISIIDIVNITDKSNPALMGRLYTSYSREIFVVNDEFLYNSDFYTGFSIYDVRDKNNPTLIGQNSTYSSLEGLFVEPTQNYAYVLTSGGLIALDIKNKTNPVFLGEPEYYANVKCEELFVYGSNLYMAGNYRGLEIYDISNPSSLKHIKHIYNGCYYESVFVVDDLCYLGTTVSSGYEHLGLHILDVSNVLSPVLKDISSFNPRVRVLGLSYDYDRKVLALASYDKGFHLINCSNNSTESFSVLYEASQNMGSGEQHGIGIGNIAVGVGMIQNRNNVLLVSNGLRRFGSVHAIDISNRKLPRFIGSYECREDYGINVIAIDGNYAYINMKPQLITGSKFGIMDISNVTNMTLISEIDSVSSPKIVFDENNFVYLIDSGSHALKVVNVSDKYEPTIISTHDLPEYASSISIVDSYLFLVGEDLGFMIVDVSDPLNPKETARSTDLDFAYDVSVEGDYAYIACQTDGLKIVSIRDKHNPFLVGSTDTKMAFRVLVRNNMIFIVEDSYGIKGFDISDPTNPLPVFEFLSESVLSIEVVDNFVFLAAGDGGLKIIELDLMISGNQNFDHFCGSTSASVVGSSSSSSSDLDDNLSSSTATTTFILEKKDYCNGRGECLAGYLCNCREEYAGDNCETWSCGGLDFKEIGKVCNGHGDCQKPQTCNCRGGYGGDECRTNKLLGQVLAPVASLSGIFLILLVVLICCCCATCCCACFCCLVVGMGYLATVVLKQTKGLKKFSKLKDFDLLLKEQELDEDTTIAHLRINRGLFEIPFEEIRTISILGEGGSNSIVFKADWKNTVVAFKCFKTRQLMSSQDKFDEFEREVEILGSLSHPNIIQFYGASMQKPRVGIVMEFACNGEILDYILKFRRESGSAYPLFQKLRMLRQIASAMLFLHSRSIIHRDLKSENVLIDEKENTKLMDFGLSRLVDTMSVSKTLRVGTSVYMAPELITDDKYSEKCDVFSFAILFHILLTEDPTPYGMDAHQVEIRVANDPSYRPDLTKLSFLRNEDGDHYEWITETIENAWNHNPGERYSFKELCDIIEKGCKQLESSKDIVNSTLSIPIFETDDRKSNNKRLIESQEDLHEEEELFNSLPKKDLVQLVLRLEEKSRKDLVRFAKKVQKENLEDGDESSSSEK